MEPSGVGTFIAFAATPGKLAFDGEGINSPFTAAIMRHIATPGLEVGSAMKRVIQDVRLQTRDQQSPQVVSNLALEFFVNKAGSSSTRNDFLAELDYARAERINSNRGWQLFLAKHSSGYYPDLASAKLAALQNPTQLSTALSPEQAEKGLRLSKNQRREIQTRLLDLGYKIGTPDGVFGPSTRKNIRNYQQAIELPDTGFVSITLLNKMVIPLNNLVSSQNSNLNARKYDVDDLKGLETDKRLLTALECLKGYPVIYAFQSGHLYLAVLAQRTFERAQKFAQRCGGHLITITSAAENRVLKKLLSEDERFFLFGYTPKVTWASGPWIGLKQDPGGREPYGGWRWVTGERVTYRNWRKGEPNEYRENSDYGHLNITIKGKHDFSKLMKRDVTTWADEQTFHSALGFIMEIE